MHLPCAFCFSFCCNAAALHAKRPQSSFVVGECRSFVHTLSTFHLSSGRMLVHARVLLTHADCFAHFVSWASVNALPCD